MRETIRLTLSQALVKYLMAQKIESDGAVQPMFAGVWAIFGHGNVCGLGEALQPVQDQLPTYRSHCEQAMAHAAVAFAKTRHRGQMMACTSSIGPGATNMVTAAAVAHVNRLPVLFLPGDTFVSRTPAPVLQQVEDFANPEVSANDCFRPVSRYFDRIVKPEQIITSLPQAMAVLTNPQDCGPVTISLPQDVQSEAFDYPVSFFAETIHRIPRIGADRGQLQQAVRALTKAEKPIIVAGGGVLYSGAQSQLSEFADRFQIPVVETSAGKGALRWDDPMNAGSPGVVGTTPGNQLLEEADLIIAVGSRLSDFTTGSRTVVSNAVTQININVTSFDAYKHNALPLQGDAKRVLDELAKELGDWRSIGSWVERKSTLVNQWESYVDQLASVESASGLPSDSQVILALNELVDKDKDVVVAAAGSMPAELLKLWRTSHSQGYHSEYGFSCMGYEIAGGIGVKMAKPDADVYVMVGDGSYMMLNAEIATSVMLGTKMIIIVLDNRGFGCINRLQQKGGGLPFNNLLQDCKSIPEGAPVIDFAAHAAAMGANAEKIPDLSALPDAVARAQASDKTYVISLDTNPVESSSGGSGWEFGVPEVSARQEVLNAHRDMQTLKTKQPY